MKFAYASGSRPLDGYTIKRGIGVGGFGEVYFATSDAGKEVALKRIQRNLDVEVRGVTHCINLKHPNLLSLYDIKYDDQGEGWIVMEYISGASLKDELDDHPDGLPHDQVEAWFDGITAGVTYLHEHGIVHRDLKPGNVFTDDGVVKIGDYGLSKFISCSRRSGQTESVGTFHYMAPEIGKGVYGREIDIYALGIILFELLTGRVPFEGESSQEIIMKHLTATPDLTGVPARYREVIRRALLKDPEQRFQTVAEMRRALGKPAVERPVLAAAGVGDYATTPPIRRNGQADDVFVIGDDDSDIVFGPVRESAATSPFHSGVPIATAATNSREEPIAKAVKDSVNRFGDWWRESAVSTPLKVLVLIGVALLLVFNSHWLVPVAIGVGVLYVCYLGVRSLILATSLSPVPAATLAATPPVGRPTGNPSNAVPVAERESARTCRKRARHWHYWARESLRRKPVGVRAAELSGSTLMASIVAAVLCLIMLIVGGYGVSSDVESLVMLMWLTLSSIAGAWLVLVLGKLWEGSEGEQIRRRFAMLVAGLAFGAMSFGGAEYLTLASLGSPDMAASIHRHGMPESMYAADGTPLLPAYLAYFGGLMLLLPWWKQADPLRRTRFSLMTTGWCVLWAWILNMFIPFPQPWGVLMAAATSVAVQLSAPWLNAEERTVMRTQARQV